MLGAALVRDRPSRTLAKVRQMTYSLLTAIEGWWVSRVSAGFTGDSAVGAEKSAGRDRGAPSIMSRTTSDGVEK